MKISLWLVLLLLLLVVNAVDLKPISTILDTDIGTDYDDQMALTYILANPQLFDLKLVVCSTFNTTARAQIVAKTLAMFNRFDVPIGIGQNTGTNSIFEYAWAENYTLTQFERDGGIVYHNGEQALLLEMAKANEENLYHVIEISPATSLGHALQRLPTPALKFIRLFAMAGSIYRGYGNSSDPSKEYNVVEDIAAAKIMFNSSWNYFGLAPVDCTNFMQFNGPEWQRFLSFRQEKVHVQVILDSYTVWYDNGGKQAGAMEPFSPTNGTSTMHDVLAAYLAGTFPQILTMKAEELPLIVSDDGFTKIDASAGKLVNASIAFLTPNPYVSTAQIGVTVLDSIINSS